MRGFDHATILSPSFHGLRKERQAQWTPPPPFVYKIGRKTQVGYVQKNWVGGCGTLTEFLTLFQTKICDYPYSVSHLIKTLIHYFWPWSPGPRRVTGARDKLLRHVHGWRTDIKREMILSLNDEEVASPKKIPNSRLECTNHTLFQTKMVEIPISDQKG